MSQTLQTRSVAAATPEATEIVHCPVTGHSLKKLSVEEIAEINGRIEQVGLRHLDGSPVQRPLQGGLKTIDDGLIYPIQQGIIVLLPALAIAEDLDCYTRHAISLRDEKRQAQEFYNDIGWTKNAQQDFIDAEKWEDLRPVSQEYIHRCHLRVQSHLPPSGRFFLDVACGPIQYPEYLTYSDNFQARVCVDISIAALREAKNKLGERGIYILGDITNLPLADGVIDGAVSLHTIYHVPRDEQAQAFREVARVLRPGSTAGIVYVWKTLPIRLLQLPAKLLRAPGKLLGKIFRRRKKESSEQKETPKLYYHAHPYRWFADQTWPFEYEIHSWRSVTPMIMRTYFHRWLLGRVALKALFHMENRFSRLLGKRGAYPLIVVRKPLASTPAPTGKFWSEGKS